MQTFKMISDGDFTNCVVVNVVAVVKRAAVQRTVVASEWIPGSMEVIGHDKH